MHTVATLVGYAIIFEEAGAGFCSKMAAWMPAPRDSDPRWYVVLTAFVNAWGGNYGHAKNQT
jgi:hypothetical protein